MQAISQASEKKMHCINVCAKVTSAGFEPAPMKTTALTLRLRPLGHDVVEAS